MIDLIKTIAAGVALILLGIGISFLIYISLNLLLDAAYIAEHVSNAIAAELAK
tara:strand:+ start:665 stop:823 length:159 start_codon:yes stop_codon:yes gene_type:complete